MTYKVKLIPGRTIGPTGLSFQLYIDCLEFESSIIKKIPDVTIFLSSLRHLQRAIRHAIRQRASSILFGRVSSMLFSGIRHALRQRASSILFWGIRHALRQQASSILFGGIKTVVYVMRLRGDTDNM